MDERTRRTDDEVAPRARRTAPLPGALTHWFPKSRLGIVLGALVLALLVYGVVRWVMPGSSGGGRNPQGAAQTVGAGTAAVNTVRVIVNALGTVTPLATVTVQTQINGQLTDVGFVEGQLVKKGDFLAQVDDRPYQILKA